jgi:arylsulfatase A-like enzyme
MEGKSNLSKLSRVLLPGILAGIFLGIIFGINSILYGYGDGILFIYFLAVFILMFLFTSLILRIYGKLRKIPSTLYNNSFLLCTALISSLIFFILVFITKYLLQNTTNYVFKIYSIGFLLILLIPLIFSIFSFVLLSSFYKKAKGYLLAVLIVCLMAPWLFITINEALALKKHMPPDKDSPNILLLTIESLRYDFTGFNGNTTIKTPSLDALAKKGIAFDNYFVQAPYTTVSLSTLHTGYYPFNHGARNFGEKPVPQYPSFIEKLAENGYLIKIDHSFSSVLFPKLSSYNTNFNETNASLFKALYYGLLEFPFIINDQLGKFIPSLFGPYCFGNTTSNRQTLKLLSQIRNNQKRKWFFWVHFIHNCHWPYGAPSYFTNMYKDNNTDLKTSYSKKEIDVLNENPEAITDNVLKGIKAAYSAEASCIDKQIGIIVDYIKKLSLDEKTVIIVSADHGELLGETGFIGHGYSLVDSLIHVPLIMYLANSGTLEGGKRITQLTEEVDIAPTILDICGIDNPSSLDGKNLFDIINLNKWQKNSIYSEVYRNSDKTFLSCLRTRQHKLVWNSSKNELELYDILSDPKERENLAKIKPEILSKLKQKLLDFTGKPNLYALTPKWKDKEIDKDMMKLLKTLGYIK